MRSSTIRGRLWYLLGWVWLRTGWTWPLRLMPRVEGEGHVTDRERWLARRRGCCRLPPCAVLTDARRELHLLRVVVLVVLLLLLQACGGGCPPRDYFWEPWGLCLAPGSEASAAELSLTLEITSREFGLAEGLEIDREQVAAWFEGLSTELIWWRDLGSCGPVDDATACTRWGWDSVTVEIERGQGQEQRAAAVVHEFFHVLGRAAVGDSDGRHRRAAWWGPTGAAVGATFLVTDQLLGAGDAGPGGS